ncbi:hypothetical protein ACIA2T_12915 [Amycolatopsis japonica]|uniref:hypothetical protein n=1 Tax=Amycolatopsis japonica TaxID=208439 RepID=UPI0037964FCB
MRWSRYRRTPQRGWTTGADPHAARLSIGIGAGNPGGGTFHAVIFQHEDGHAFSLTSDPFERVPQGGPDLTADEARAHEDLPFVWAVADDGMWQLIGASDADGGTGKVGHLHHAIDEDPTLIDVLDLPPGGRSARTGVGNPWAGRA